jgi:hypothetical protein
MTLPLFVLCARRAGPPGLVRDMDQITIKTPNPKCRLYWCLNRVYRLEIQSVMLVFSTPLVNYRPSNLLPGSPPPPSSPSLGENVQGYIQCVTGGG